MPAALGDDVLAESAKHRSKSRVPALSWYNRRTGAPLCRASQPLAGLRERDMPEDESAPVSRKPFQFHFNMTLYESMRAMFVSRSRELVQG